MLHPVTLLLTLFLGFLAFLLLSLRYVYVHNRTLYESIQRRNKVWTICPNCGNLVWLQTFLCPACKTENVLNPNMDADFNVHLAQTCSKCAHVLPVAHFWGREQLTAVCPECRKSIGEQAGIYHELVIPIIGSRSTGKSAYLSALLFSLLKRYGSAVKFPFPGTADYAMSAYKRYAAGHLPEQTPKSIPNGLVVDWENNSETRLEIPGLRILFYDAGGEIYNEEKSMGDLKYLDFMDGLMLIVDPFTFHEVRRKYADQLANQPVFQAGEYPLEDTVARIRNGFGKYRYKDYDYENLNGKRTHPYLGTSDREVHFCRCAVVITKTDMFDLDSQIGSAAVQERLRKHPNLSADEALNQICGEKLREWGLGNELKILDELFREVRYFSVSALGHLPEPSKQFEPHRVELPLQWLLKQCKQCGCDFWN